MALPVTIPNAFANATASIPLSQLDTNFNTLANAVNGISDGSETLANVTATVANITTANVGALNTSGQVVFNDAGADVDFRVEGDTEANLLFVDASADRVGIGTNTLTSRFTVNYTNSTAYTAGFRTAGVSVVNDDTTSGVSSDLYFSARGDGASGASGSISLIHTGDGDGAFSFITRNNGNPGERMRIDSSGNVLVGKTSGSISVAGTAVFSTGLIESVRDGNKVMTLNRLTSDGDILEFRKDGTAVGSIGTIATGNIYVVNGLSGLIIGDNLVAPSDSDGTARDNLVDLGNVSRRFDDIYATNATIQTSDRNEKQDIEELSEAETRVAVAAKGLLRKYRWKDAVAEKGDDARIHFGIIAQDLQAAFEAEGLDAGRYAMFIHSTWWEKERVIPAVEGKEAVLDDEGNVVEEAVEAQPERTVIDTFETEEEGAVRKERMGIRYNELLAFIIAAL